MSNSNNLKEKIIFFDITGKCNLRCKHCYQWKTFKEQGRDIFELNFKEIKNTIDRLVKEKFTRLHILGGEPLLSPQLFPTIKYAKNKKMLVSIVTNGLLLSQNAPLLKKYKIDLISVSFEGTNPKKHDFIRGMGNYDKTIKSILQTMQQYPNLPIAAVFTITSNNIDDVKNIPNWLKNNRFFGINLQIVGMDGNAINNPGLKIDTVTALKEIEKIIPKLIETKIEFDIKTSNIVKRYFEEKFNINMDIVDERCKGLKKQIYWSRGRLLPCNAAEPYVKPLSWDDKNIKNTKIQKSTSSFRKYVKNISNYKKLEPCNSCPYFGNKCLPCPILTFKEGKTYQLKSCKWAIQKLIRRGVIL